MGTRATIVIEDNGTKLVRVYRQFDGYPSGLGQDIVDTLAKGKATLVNGYSPGKHGAPQTFNGIQCLAAYLIGQLKGDTIGNVYIAPIDADAEEYEYTLYANKTNVLCVRILGHGKKLYDGELSKVKMDKLEKDEE